SAGGGAGTGALRSYVDGVWRDGVRTVVRTDPAHPTTVVAEVSLADAVLASAAVLAARKAFASWRATPAPARGEILRRAADLMEHQVENIGRDLTREEERRSARRSGRPGAPWRSSATTPVRHWSPTARRTPARRLTSCSIRSARRSASSWRSRRGTFPSPYRRGRSRPLSRTATPWCGSRP